MSKQLNVKMNVTADTKQAEKALADLSSNLSKIASITPTQGLPLTKDLEVAKQSAKELQQHLLNAFNTKTGNLDLNKLDASLKSSGQNLGELSSNLLRAGQTGQQAFMNMQRAISNASVQINKANGILGEFWTTLKNTARWQISSSVLHGFMGALNSALGYAKDLDKSLNNIRIVTGYSADEMAKFAEQANKAAKELSTTTTKYTDAALIFYQQGLNDEEVARRTEITVKMANAAGKSAAEVSDQLTAVWNNFYDGTKSLEYYADVMTALGAATASSTDEIAGGLEKFAAIGETIGLSYEYAAAALATITSNTRQSEDVVGTALKTIFARIQGLSLGETLDDGTTLNKYSEALQKIGISIFDSAGELKNMDSILDEMAAKWDVLNSAQQTALAQTVAGTRQYTQLVALMENWNAGDSDSMVANLKTVEESTGTLQAQADIYADSWQAATNRVRAAAEGIYEDLIPTEEMKGLANGFATVLEGVDGLVEGMGGLQGILLLVANIAMTKFSSEIGAGLDSAIGKVGSLFSASNNLKGLWQNGGIIGSTSNMISVIDQIASKTKDVAAQTEIFEKNFNGVTSAATKTNYELGKNLSTTKGINTAFGEYNSNMLQVNNIQSAIEQANNRLTQAQKEQLSVLQQQALAANEEVLAIQNAYEAEKARTELMMNSEGDRVQHMIETAPEVNNGQAYDTGIIDYGKREADLRKFVWFSKEYSNNLSESEIKIKSINGSLRLTANNSFDLSEASKESKQIFEKIYDTQLKINDVQKNTDPGNQQKAAERVLENLRQQDEKAASILDKYIKQGASFDEIVKGVKNATNGAELFARSTGNSETSLDRMKIQIGEANNKWNQYNQSAEKFKNIIEQSTNFLKNSINGAMSYGNIIAQMAGGFSSVAMGINSVSNAIKTLGDEDASLTTKLSAGAMAATMGIKALMTTYGGLKTIIDSVNASKQKTIILNSIQNGVEEELTNALEKQDSVEIKNILMSKLGIANDQAEIVTTELLTKAKEKGTAATTKDTVANYANAASQAAKYWQIALVVAVLAALAIGIKAVIDAQYTEEEAARDAAKSVENLTERYKELADAANKFKDTQDGYKDALNNLKELEKGTEEYAEALEDANDKAKELIETYGLYDDYYISDGKIIIDQTALDTKQAELDQKAREVEGQKYNAQIYQSNVNLDNQTRKLSEKTVAGYTTYYNPYAGSTTVENRASTSDVKLISDLVNQYKDAHGGVTPDQEELIEYVNKFGEDLGISNNVLENLNTVITNETIKDFQDLAEATKEAREANEYYTKQILGVEIEKKQGEDLRRMATDENGNFDQSKYDQLLAIYSDKAYNENTQKEIENVDVSGIGTRKALQNLINEEGGKNLEAAKEIFGSDFNADVFSSDKGLAQYYGQMEGYGDAESLHYSGGWGKGTITVNGEKVIDGLSDDYMLKEIAKQIKIKAIAMNYGDGSEEFDEAMNQLIAGADAAGQQYGADFSSAILNTLSSGDTAIDLSGLFSQLDSGEVAEIQNMTDTEILALFGIDDDTKLEQLGYEEGKDFADAIRNGLEDYDPAMFVNAVNAEFDALAESLGLDEKQFSSWRKVFEEGKGLSKSSEKWLKSLKSKDVEAYTRAVNELAIAQVRLEQGSKTLGENWEDWKEVLSSTDVEMSEVVEILPDLQQSMADILNMDLEDIQSLPTEFFTENWKAIQDVYDGADGAVEKLQGLAAKQYILNLKVDKEEFKSDTKKIEEILSDFPDLEVGVGLDNGKLEILKDELNTLLKSFQITEAEANEILGRIGFKPEIKTLSYNVPTVDPLTGNVTWTEVQYPYIASAEYEGPGGLESKTPSDYGDEKGNKSSKEIDRIDISKQVDRYQEIDRALDNNREKIEAAERAMEHLYGDEKIAKMQEINGLLLEEGKLLEERAKQAEKYAQEDRTKVNELAKGFGNITVEYDAESGDILNQTSIEEELWGRWNSRRDRFAEGGFTEEESENLEKFKKQIEDFIDAMGTYHGSLEEFEQALADVQDSENERLSNNYDALEEKFERENKIFKDQLEQAEEEADALEDDFRNLGESQENIIKRLRITNEQTEAYIGQLEELRTQYEAGEIGANDYQTALEELGKAMKEQEKIVQDLKKEFEEAWASALEDGAEEVEAYIDRMENLSKTLGHYKDIVEMTGGKHQYEKFGVLLSGQSEIANAEMIGAKGEVQMMEAARQFAQEEYEKYKGTASEETYKKNLEAAEKALEEANNLYLSKAQEYLEALKAELQNSLDEAAYNLEQSLTQGMGFDSLNSSMDRMQQFNDEYLTTTNKIYETQTLMNTAQKALDKTTNEAAKKRLKNYIDETKALQDKNKLSHLELEIQKAQYDVLLAEIALEEAQNAKSTVRLRRDSEGNFGYVYTADQDAVAGAEQELLDAQNTLYNIGLEGANEYAQKYLQAREGLANDLADLERRRAEGEFASEQEYWEERNRIYSEWEPIIEAYSEQYAIATGVDANIVSEAWTSSYSSMINDGGAWKNAVNTYTVECATAFKTYQDKIDGVATEVGTDLEGLRDKTGEITTKADELKKAIIGDGENKGLVGAFQDELTELGNLSEAYQTQIDKADALKKSYEELATAAGEAAKAQEGLNTSNEENNAPTTPTTPSNTTNQITPSGGGGTSNNLISCPNCHQMIEISQLNNHLKECTKINVGYSDTNNYAHSNSQFGNTVSAYDTGGYTGIWGPEGKLAVLHEKELILNAGDTENFLAAIDVVRKISDQIDFTSKLMGLSSMSALGFGLAGDLQQLEQNVHIEASFPNVSDRNEIQEAFNNLINTASQYANRKNK